MVILMTFQLE
uniref:Uncharacterized protein n=1 Tax=Arundo donax TaxID=35708 RepID=A0A0A9G471_ARUDO